MCLVGTVAVVQCLCQVVANSEQFRFGAASIVLSCRMQGQR